MQPRDAQSEEMDKRLGFMFHRVSHLDIVLWKRNALHVTLAVLHGKQIQCSILLERSPHHTASMAPESPLTATTMVDYGSIMVTKLGCGPLVGFKSLVVSVSYLLF